MKLFLGCTIYSAKILKNRERQITVFILPCIKQRKAFKADWFIPVGFL